jgi:rubrerythrin
MSAKSHVVRDVLLACRDVEQAMFELYNLLATLHADDAEMAKLWKKTANEERNHAAQFTLALETAQDTIEAVNLDVSAIRQTAQAVELLRQDCLKEPPGIRQALVAVIAFEESMAGIHLDKIAVFAEERHRQLFHAMMAADRQHIGRLREALLGPSSLATTNGKPPPAPRPRNK